MKLKSLIIGLLLSAPVIAFLSWYGYVTITALAAGGSGALMSQEAFANLDAPEQLAHIQQTTGQTPAQVNIDRLFQWIADHPQDPQLPEAYDTLGDLRIRQIFSTEPAEFKKPHLIEPGDSLRALSIRQNSTPGAIMRANNLLEDTLHPGQRIQIPVLNTNAVVHLQDKQLALYLDGKFLQSYPIEEITIPEEEQARLPFVAEVLDKPSLYGGQTVRYGDSGYLKSSRRITLENTPIILYSSALPEKENAPEPTPEAADASAPAGNGSSPATGQDQTPQPREAEAEIAAGDADAAGNGSEVYTGPGIQLSRAHMEEVFLLLTGQSRVKITR